MWYCLSLIAALLMVLTACNEPTAPANNGAGYCISNGARVTPSKGLPQATCRQQEKE